jgi:hypothetical protein
LGISSVLRVRLTIWIGAALARYEESRAAGVSLRLEVSTYTLEGPIYRPEASIYRPEASICRPDGQIYELEGSIYRVEGTIYGLGPATCGLEAPSKSPKPPSTGGKQLSTAPKLASTVPTLRSTSPNIPLPTRRSDLQIRCVDLPTQAPTYTLEGLICRLEDSSYTQEGLTADRKLLLHLSKERLSHSKDVLTHPELRFHDLKEGLQTERASDGAGTGRPQTGRFPAFLAGQAGALGNQQTIVVPRPSSLSADTLPPCASTICFTMARPSPVPPSSRERD